MIPKIIHYCWFGRNPLPKSAKNCINSWKRFLPDYEIKEWNEDNFDVNIVPYTAEAYKARKYAFVSDYARFWILSKYGGLYFDTDVEIIRPLDDIISRGSFMGCQNEVSTKQNTDVNPGLGLGLQVAPGLGSGLEEKEEKLSLLSHRLFEELLNNYSNIHFINTDGSLNKKTIVTYTTELLVRDGLQPRNEIQCIDGIYIYPKEYFCPKDYPSGELHLTSNSRCIHHFDATWLRVPIEQQLEARFWDSLGINRHRLMWHLDNFLNKLGFKRY